MPVTKEYTFVITANPLAHKAVMAELKRLLQMLSIKGQNLQAKNKRI